MTHGFQDVQHRFTAYLRDPEGNVPLEDIEPRRLEIYRDLFYNNVAGFLSQGFPVIHTIMSEKNLWHALVREFFSSHSCRSPYFVDIPGDFVSYLSNLDLGSSRYPPYLADMAHYEWLEMVLEISPDETRHPGMQTNGNLLDDVPVINPIHRLVEYSWPVTTIAPDNEPVQVLTEPLQLLLLRDQSDKVRFLEINTASRMLAEQLAERPGLTGKQHLEALSRRLPEFNQATVLRFGAALIEDFRLRGFILGSRTRPPTF